MEERRDARGLTEAEAIARYQSRNYPKPALTADIIAFAHEGEKLQILLIERGGHPFIGKLALPGGFANEKEPVEETAARELEEETGVQGLDLKLVGVYSGPGRDPRGWVASVAFMAETDKENIQIQAGDDAATASWYDLLEVDEEFVIQYGDQVICAKDLAFDHGKIIKDALKLKKNLTK